MIARFVQDGKSVDYRPAEAVAAGSVIVQDGLVGIARLDIAAGTLGSLATVGVFEFVKHSGEVIGTGASVYFDENAQCATLNASGNIPLGKAVAGSDASAATVHVLLCAGGSMQSSNPAPLTKLTDQSGGVASDNIPGTDMGSRDAVASLAAKVNAVIDVLQSAGLVAAEE